MLIIPTLILTVTLEARDALGSPHAAAPTLSRRSMAFATRLPVSTCGAGRARSRSKQRPGRAAQWGRSRVRMQEVGEEPADGSGVGADGVIDVSARTRSMSTEELKRELYMLSGACDRGFRASPEQRTGILDVVAQLEQSAECLSPCDDPRLLGDWALVYTNGLDVISLALLGPVASVSGVFQNVFEGDGGNLQVVNVVEFEPPWAPIANSFFERSVARLQVFSMGVRSSPNRLDIQFERAKLRKDTIAGFEVPAPFPALEVPLKTDVGYIDTTFLDDELRIARAPAGSLNYEGVIFVLRRVLDSASGYG